jgi:hypothetical protein
MHVTKFKTNVLQFYLTLYFEFKWLFVNVKLVV